MEGQRVGRTKGPLTCLIHQRVGLGQAHLVAQVHCWAPLPQKRQEISRHITNKRFWGPSSLPPFRCLLSSKLPLIPVLPAKPPLIWLWCQWPWFPNTLCSPCPHPYTNGPGFSYQYHSTTHHARVEVAWQPAVSVRSALTLAGQNQAKVSDAQGMQPCPLCCPPVHEVGARMPRAWRGQVG